MEVISAKLNGNGTVGTAVDVNRLQSHHRRTRRSSKEIDLASFQTRISHKVLIFKRQNIRRRHKDMSGGLFPVKRVIFRKRQMCFYQY